jgi:hypothetical protein
MVNTRAFITSTSSQHYTFVFKTDWYFVNVESTKISSGLEGLDDLGVRLLGSVLVVVQETVVLALEDARDPRVAVGDTPGGDAHAARDGLAGGDDVRKVLGVLVDDGLCDRGRGADVELGESDVEAEVGKALEVGLEVGGDSADNEVRLETDTVDELLLVESLDQLVSSVGLGVDPFNVVIILNSVH